MTTPDQMSFTLSARDFQGRVTRLTCTGTGKARKWEIKSDAANQLDDTTQVSGLTSDQLVEIGAIATAAATGTLKL